MNEVTMNEVKDMVENTEDNEVVTVWIGGEKNEEYTK